MLDLLERKIGWQNALRKTFARDDLSEKNCR